MARKMKGLNLRRSNTSSTAKSNAKHRIADHHDQVSGTVKTVSETVTGFLQSETTSGASKCFAKAEALATAAKRLAVESGKYASSQILSDWRYDAQVGDVFVLGTVPIAIRSDRRSFSAFYLLDITAMSESDRKKGKRVIDPVSTEDLAEKLLNVGVFADSEEVFWAKVDAARAERLREALEAKKGTENNAENNTENGAEPTAKDRKDRKMETPVS